MRTPPILALLFLLAAAPAWGQVTIGPDGVPRAAGGDAQPKQAPDRGLRAYDGPEVVELTVSPAPLPDPPLRYRLVIPAEDRVPGNAAIYWYRSVLLTNEANVPRPGVETPEYAASELLGEPPADLSSDRIARELGFGLMNWPALDAAASAARRPGAEWEYGLDRLGGREAVEFLLPEFQAFRTVARFLVLRGRMSAGAGDHDAALADATVGFRLAEDCGAGPFLIGDLVGVAIHNMTVQHVVEAVIAAPDSPNLYWALTELPDPAAGIENSWDYELTLPYRFAPWLKQAETLDWPASRWREELSDLYRTVLDIDGRPGSGPLQADLALGLLFTAKLPAARAALLADGFTAERLDAMPPGQILAVRQNRVMQRTIQRYRAALALPTLKALPKLDAYEDDLRRAGRDGSGELLPMIELLFPAVNQALRAGQRVRADLAALRTVEALRAHAAETGSFPASLAAIDAVPVPENPVTGEPFGYRLEDGTAVLEVVRDATRPAAGRVIRLSLRE